MSDGGVKVVYVFFNDRSADATVRRPQDELITSRYWVEHYAYIRSMQICSKLSGHEFWLFSNIVDFCIEEQVVSFSTKETFCNENWIMKYTRSLLLIRTLQQSSWCWPEGSSQNLLMNIDTAEMLKHFQPCTCIWDFSIKIN